MSRNEVDHILFGAAYYDEYLMMKGIDRIGSARKVTHFGSWPSMER